MSKNNNITLTQLEIKQILDNFLNFYPSRERINFDPLFFPRYAYELLKNSFSYSNSKANLKLEKHNKVKLLYLQIIESVAITSAFLAFGNVKAFMKTLQNIFNNAVEIYNYFILNTNNHYKNKHSSQINSFVPNSDIISCRKYIILKDNIKNISNQLLANPIAPYDKNFAYKFYNVILHNQDFDFNVYYRFCTKEDLNIFFKFLGIFYSKFSSFYNVFYNFYLKSSDIHQILCNLYDIITKIFEENGLPFTQGIKHLISNPHNRGVCKRWMLFFRWMIRPDDGIDLGLWKGIKPNILVIPVDKHISRISRLLGFTTRKTDDWQTALEITNYLKNYDENDPIKYDFALCHLGISKFCINNLLNLNKNSLDQTNCVECKLVKLCKFSKN